MDWVGSYRGWPPFTGLWEPSANNWDIGPYGQGHGVADDTSVLAHAHHVDWGETDTAHVFRADLPGVRKEDLKVQVEEGNMLQISGERVEENEDTNDKWHRVERRRGSFMRRFQLPENANMDKIECNLVNGVLTVNVPKLETKPQQNKNVRQIDVA